MTSSGVPEDALAGLTAMQREAARQEGPVVVLAGAGTGKTKTLVAGVVDRIVRRGMPAHRILAVTFTNKAADEMRTRINAVLGLGAAPSWIGTFHGHGRRQLRADPEIAVLRPGFDICDAEDSRRIVRRLLQRAADDGAWDPGDADTFRARVRSVAQRIALMKDSLVLPDQAEAVLDSQIARFGAKTDEDLMAWHMAAALYPAYQAALREVNCADFGDLLLWPTVTMLRDEQYRLDWARRFDAILADEFQDVNRLQYLWLKLLSRDHGELFAVGDDDQSIYSWRGASVGFIRDFLSEFPNGRMIPLEQNFRSTGHILAAANSVVARDSNRLDKTLFTEQGEGAPIEIVAFSGGQQEAQGLAREIGRRQLLGVALEDMAILYRYNFLSRMLEEELLRAHIPYELVNDTAFWQRAVVKDVLALLRLADNPDVLQGDEAFRRVINQPARGVGARTLARIEQLARDEAVSLFVAAEKIYATSQSKTAERVRAFLRMIREEAHSTETALGTRMRILAERSGYLDMLRAAGEDGGAGLENLDELFSLAMEFTGVEDLFDHAALGAAAATEAGQGRVRLMTIHGSKGLEFEHVFLMGWEDTLFPGLSPTNLDEERRLAYVALTRGRARVSISWCAWRNGRSADMSPFVGDIPPQARYSGWLGKATSRAEALANRAALDEALGI
ncbi:ATP-dependent helicase [Acetobacter lovaniensis]|uniref:DNA 3'-5' helicase n=1 Tax=Acetobacter lovaniensis TaxID=104100 RepID=A0A841QKD1_9PROT|nr:ATP-dependent helicase [Acetobacter lovaniensis]MBB6458442.1 DNA helicase-2/ATP-dependent DNA helicase PcrA [Acetobacter lovaniensis]NHN82665.1 AAA family ATPase [Acetobacter lovaniensis]GBQ74578.1 DNA helicase II [Acetobacter lovaniensis NRIC 0474]